MATAGAAGAGQFVAWREDVPGVGRWTDISLPRTQNPECRRQPCSLSRSWAGRLGKPVGALTDAERQSLVNVVEQPDRDTPQTQGCRQRVFLPCRSPTTWLIALPGVTKRRVVTQGAARLPSPAWPQERGNRVARGRSNPCPLSYRNPRIRLLKRWPPSKPPKRDCSSVATAAEAERSTDALPKLLDTPPQVSHQPPVRPVAESP